jgi:drug/metabolite transporter (DMT)-like permease
MTLAILTLFTLSWLLSKDVIDSIPPLHAVGLRLTATAGTLWLLMAALDRQSTGIVSLRSVGAHLFLLSVLGFSLYFACTFEALKTLQPSELTMVLTAIPGITYLLGLFSRSVAFSWIKTLGVLICSAAAWAFNIPPTEGLTVQGYGVALAAIAAFSYSLYGLLSRRYLQHLPILTSLAWITSIASVSFFPLLIFDPEPLLRLKLFDLSKVIVLGAICSAPVYVLYQKVLIEGGVLYANAIGLLAPIAVIVGEWLIGSGSPLTPMKLLALLGVTIGMTFLLMDASKSTGNAMSRHASSHELSRK